MTLSDLSIHRPVFAVMVVMALVVFGAIGYTGLGVSQFPDVEFPVVTVATVMRGAAPEVMEADVTEIIEKSVSSVQGIRTLTSQSVQGASIVTVEFELSRSIDLAVQDVRDKVAAVTRELPRDIEPPQITKVNPGDSPILWLSLYGTRPYSELVDYADNVLSDEIQRIPGVGDIFPGARRKREVRLWVSAQRLEAYAMSVDEVISAVGRQHLESPAGRLESAQIEFNLRTMGEFRTIDELNQLVVAERRDAVVRLRDVAVVEDGLEDKRTFARYNGMPAAGLGIRKQRGANTVAVARAVKAKLAEMWNNLPEGMNLVVAFDSSRFIEEAINEIQFTLLFAILLTAVITHVFLLSFRSTLIIALSMPVSVIGTFSFMYFMGFTLNTLTLLGLSLSVGIVVDDAIIFLENIYRHQEEGQKRKEAALAGAREITFAALASTLSIVAIFIPVAFMQGIIGRFFYEFGITVSVAILVSYVFALTLTPMLCSRYLQPGTARDPLSHLIDRFIEAWPPLYRRFLGLCLRLRWVVLVLTAAVFAASLYFLFLLGREFVPSEDQGRLLLHIRTPVGSSVDYTDEMLVRCEAIADRMPEIQGYFAAVGIGQERMANRGIMFITLLPRDRRERSQVEVQKALREEMAKIPGMLAFVQDLSSMGLSAQRGYPIEFALQGPDLDKLAEHASVLKDRMKGTPGILDVDSNYEVGMPEIRIHPDREKAADLGVDVASINRTVQSLFGGVEIAKFNDRGKRYDVRLRLMAGDRYTPAAIGGVRVRGGEGQLLAMRDLVRLEDRASLLMVNRYNRQRAITITANVGGNLKQSEALLQVEAMAREVLPEGYSITFSGTAQTFRDTFTSLIFALVLGLVVAYMILAAQFNHFLHPLTVMAALPFSLTGALVVLWATGQTLNLYSMIGILLLMGLVKKNSILLVDFTSQFQAKGHSCREALLLACPLRLRPILMTSASTIVGALPVMLHLGPGAESRKPMAVAVVGGMIASTLLTLVVVPILHELIDSFGRWFRGPSSAAPVVEAAPHAREAPAAKESP
ncbi:MAG: efflux RND transporter permease subunit [Planctomycetes bacterium]|nr:efflux RND transporter permease subunit [Planctomycetota bacterium]